MKLRECWDKNSPHFSGGDFLYIVQTKKTNVMLIKPSAKYINRIENSWHYLNCPKHMLNYDLDCLYRQAKGLENGKEVDYISDYLKHYDISEPRKKAEEFVKFRSSISLQEFNKINVNSYIEKTPAHIDAKHKSICEWTDRYTTYYPAIYGGGIKSVPSYPFRY
jgi:hypothetical protein